MHEIEFTLTSGTTYKSQLPDDLSLAAAASLLKRDWRTHYALVLAEVPRSEKRHFLCALAAAAFVSWQEGALREAISSPGLYDEQSPETQQQIDKAVAWALRPDSEGRPLTVASFARDVATTLVCLRPVPAGSQMPSGIWTDALARHGAEFVRLRTAGHTSDAIAAALAADLATRKN